MIEERKLLGGVLLNQFKRQELIFDLLKVNGEVSSNELARSEERRVGKECPV